MSLHISPDIGSLQAEFPDRRRPGRIEDVRPELLPLLRRSELLPAGAALSDEIEQVALGAGDSLSAARGIALAIALAAPIWAAAWFLALRLL